MIIAILAVLLVNYQTYESSNFLEGTFEDGYGVSLYVTPEGELRTLGNDWDLNDDGWLDAVVINEFKGCQAEYEWYSYVFWGSEEGFNRQHCDSFFTSGAECAALADFDRDGWTDIVVANSLGESMHSYVIYGFQEGYTHSRIDSFSAKENHGSVSVADFNQDGWLDLVWSHWLVWGDGNSRIYWGNRDGFSDKKTTLLPAASAHGNVIADFDKDGYADILWAVYYTWGQIFKRDCLIFWGAKDGFRNHRISKLDGTGPGDDISVADLNKDGNLDIVMANRSDKPPPVERYYDYSYIYYGKGDRAFQKDSLCAYGPWGSSVADLNDDGWLDIVFACSADEHDLIYYGSPDGFEKSETIPASYVSCTFLADFDNDGDCDMILGRQGRSQLTFLSQTESGWESETWYGVGGVDAGVTRDIGNPATRLDEYGYVSPTITVTSAPDSIAVLEDITADYHTTWQGDGEPLGAGLELWVSASTYPYGDSWTEWVKINGRIPGALRGRAFRYKLCLHTGFRTSIVVPSVKLYVHLEESEDTLNFPKIIRLSGSRFAVWLGEGFANQPLFLYDILGRKVLTFTTDDWGYAVMNGNDNNEQPLTRGSYFLVIPKDKRYITHKLLLLGE